MFNMKEAKADFFNWTCSFRRDSDIYMPYFLVKNSTLGQYVTNFLVHDITVALVQCTVYIGIVSCLIDFCS